MAPAPALNLPANLGHSPVADGKDQARLLGQGNEIHGRDKAALRMPPANEGLQADDAARGELDLGLVVQDKLVLLEGAAQVGALWPRPG